MTAEELLKTLDQQEEVQEYCIIDASTRLINVPPKFQMLGVESDEKAERIYFQCPKIVGDGLDLTTLALRINYQNAGNEKDQYIVEDVQVSGEDITFSWLLSRKVTKYKGKVQFILCAVKTDDEKITNEWNTTLSTSEVLDGLEVDVEVTDEEQDVIKQLIALSNQAIVDCKNSTDKANAAVSNANGAAQEAKNAAEDARDVIEQIQKESYMHTALQSFVNETTATPTAYGNALVEKLEGYIQQDGTPSPESPIPIKGVGDMGFFDGELRQGYYTTTNGSYIENTDYICSENVIRVKPNDTLFLSWEFSGQGIMCFYKLDGTFVSGGVTETIEQSTFEKIVPAEAELMLFGIYKRGGVTSTTVGHICLTINSKYAVCVKNEGKNLVEKMIVGAYMYDSGKYTNSLTYFCCNNLIEVKPDTTYVVKNYSSDLQCDGIILYDKNRNKIKTFTENASKARTTSDTMYLTFNLYNKDNTYTLFDVRNVQLEEGDTSTEYVPYQSNKTYIPVDYPLFEGDKIYKENGEYKVLKKQKQVIFDGSNDEVWSLQSTNEYGINNFFINMTNESDYTVFQRGKCNKLEKQETVIAETKTEGIYFNTANIYVRLKKERVADVSALKTWLQQNPLTVVYELQTPTEEPISAETQKALYSIMSCDEKTDISIAGVPADAEIQNQFLLPRNMDGALNTTAYATAKKTEIEAEQQKQEMQKRLAALEQLAIKEA